MFHDDDFPALPLSAQKRSPAPKEPKKPTSPPVVPFDDESSWGTIFDTGDQIDDECIPALLSGCFTIEEISQDLYHKFYVQKTVLLNMYDLYRLYQKLHPELLLTIASAPALASSGGTEVLKRCIQVLAKQHGFSRPLAFAFVVFVSISDSRNPKLPLATSFLCFWLPKIDSKALAFLQSCSDGLTAETISCILQSDDCASLWGSPGVLRLTPALAGVEASGIHWM